MMEEEQRDAKGEGTNPLLLILMTEEKQTQAKESRSPLEIKNVPQLTTRLKIAKNSSGNNLNE